MVMATSRRLLCATALLGCLAPSVAKLITGQTQLDGEVPERYISKFSINGGGTIEGSLTTADGKDFETGGIALFIFNAEDWPKYHKLPTCMDRARLATSLFSIANQGEVNAEQALQNTYRLQRFKGEYKFKRELKPEKDGEVLYVVIADCSLEQIFHKVPPINYHITFLNQDSHIPADMYTLRATYIVLVCLLFAAGGYGTMLVKSQQQSLGSLPLISKMLMGAYFLNLIGTLFMAIHLQIYTSSGSGMWILESLSILSNACFKTVVNFVLLALACGWTLTDDSSGMAFMVALRDPSKMFKITDSGVPAITAVPSALVVLLFIIFFIVVEFYDLMTSNREDDHGKAHNHDSAAGRLLMLMEVAFCGLFLFTTSSTRKVVNLRQKDFLLWLMVAGALWFLVTPVLVVTSPMMARVSRHRIITVGSISLQSTALVLMCRLFLTRSSEYYKLSSMANMGTIVGLSGSGGSGRMGGKAMD